MLKYIMSLPFEDTKRHRIIMKAGWKRQGLIHPNPDALYNMFVRTTHCNICNKIFTKRRDRHMDHDHETGKFRYILCRACNLKMDRKINKNNKLGLKHIGKYGDYYHIKIHRFGKYVLNKKRKSLVDAIKVRDEYLQSESIFNENLKIKEKNICKEDIKILCSDVVCAETSAKSMCSSNPTAVPVSESEE